MFSPDVARAIGLPSRNDITLLIDTKPLSSDNDRLADFNSLFVFSALSDPLFRFDSANDELVNSACEEVSISKNFKRFELRLRKDLRWSTGECVSACEYVHRFCSASPVELAVFFGNNNIVATSQYTDDNVLVIESETPDMVLLQKLAHPVFSPRCKLLGENLRYSGPFSLTAIKDDRLVFAPNRYHRAFGDQSPGELNMVVCNKVDDNVHKFFNGEADVTCSAYFPFDQLEQLRQSDSLVWEPSQTFIVLLPMDRKASNHNLRKSIMHLINRSELQEVSSNALALVENFHTKQSQTPVQKPIDQLHSVDNGIHYLSQFKKSCRDIPDLKIAYDDYYPNHPIAENISRQLERFDVRTQVVLDDFVSPGKIPCDFKLIVLVGHTEYPASVYRQIGLLDRACMQCLPSRYWSILDDYDCEPSPDNRANILLEANQILIEFVPVLLMGRLEHFFLRRSRLSDFRWDTGLSWDRLLMGL